MQHEVGTVARYDAVAMALHWLLALALIGQILLGFYLQEIPRGVPARSWWVNLHKSTGLVLFALILLRLGWRLAHPPPALPAMLSAWERKAASFGHALLYACMLALPLSGYIASNFSKWGVKLFNVVELPPWGPEDKTVYAVFNGAHRVLAVLFATLVVLHVLAALKHLLVDRDRVFDRMLPRRRSGHGART
jgi:cytochrome b561